VWTARKYILEEALATSRLRDVAAEFPRPNEVLVEVGKLSIMQRGEIVYNHAKQAKLSSEHCRLIRTHAIEIADHPNFSPLRISQLMSGVLKPVGDANEDRNVNWKSVQDFLNDPGDHWIQAYRAVSPSEQTLLAAMLDFDGPTDVRSLRSNYELRISKRTGGHLSFEDCVNRLDHSFLTLISSHGGEQYVTMQHPSLRDMLLLHLSGDADARRRYISLASAFGLSGIISGIARSAESEATPQHVILPNNQEEFGMFINRLREVSCDVLTPADWKLLLNSSERLIPHKTSPVGIATVNNYYSEFLPVERSMQEVEPADLDLKSFGATRKGQIIRAVLEGFSSTHTIENGRRFRTPEWVQILTLFYRLAGYVSPPLYPTFTNELFGEMDDPEESIRLVNVVHDAEPVVVKQKITSAQLNDWTHDLEALAAGLTQEGSNFDVGDDPDEYDLWEFRARRFLGTAQAFASWSPAGSVNGLAALESVLEEGRRPPERDPDDYREEELPVSGDYWTLQRLFEDL
jgi:hypothetical protein